MALSEDQIALLRLLAQREEGYEDIAALLGLSVGEVRTRVRGALAELDSGGAPAAAPPPEPAREEAARPAQQEVARPAPAEPEPLEPAAPEPEPARKRAAPKPPPRKRRSGLGGISWTRRRVAELAGGALALILLVLFVTGAVDLDGGDSGSDADGATGGRGVTEAVLTPPEGGSDASGRAVFGRVEENAVLQVEAQNVPPSPKGMSYAVWFYRSPKLALRIGAVRVGGKEEIGAQFPIPVELLRYVAAGAFNQIRISLTDNDAYAQQVARARKRQQLPRFAGTTVLSGQIDGPLINAGNQGQGQGNEGG